MDVPIVPEKKAKAIPLVKMCNSIDIGNFEELNMDIADENSCLEAYLTGLISADGGLYTSSRHGYHTDFVADSCLEK